MIFDTSALAAMLRAEADAPRSAKAPAGAGESKRIPAANFLETAIVIDGSRDAIASRRLDELIGKPNLVIEPVTKTQAKIARLAYRDFGKGSGLPAALIFDDYYA